MLGWRERIHSTSLETSSPELSASPKRTLKIAITSLSGVAEIDEEDLEWPWHLPLDDVPACGRVLQIGSRMLGPPSLRAYSGTRAGRLVPLILANISEKLNDFLSGLPTVRAISFASLDVKVWFCMRATVEGSPKAFWLIPTADTISTVLSAWIGPRADAAL